MSETCLERIEQAWKLKTEASNKLFKKGRYLESLQGYEEALLRAEILNKYQKEAINFGIPSIQLFAISCNNLAFTYEKTGVKEKGEKMLRRVIYFLLFQFGKNTPITYQIGIELKKAMLNYSEYAIRNKLKIENEKKVFKDIKQQLSLD